MLGISQTNTPYHLYKATFKNILEEIALVDNENTATPIPYYVCAGHTEFFHRYVSKERGKKKVEEYLEKVFYPNRDIKEAHYEILSQNTILGKESGYFKGLNRIYNHVIQIVYQHKDNSLNCPYHPFHDTHRITPA